MSGDRFEALPTIVLPYTPPPAGAHSRDIFVYLRPETNGIRAESTLLKVIEENPLYRTHIGLVYLANIPGEFMAEHRLVEEQYAHKMPFARRGRSCFTHRMKKGFEAYFGESFETAQILGAFDALDVLGVSAEEMFSTWVDDTDILILNGQNIKRIGGLYVVDYDIPALLAKYRAGTDIAVMMFRSTLSAADFAAMITDMEHALRLQGLLGESVPRSRAFHVSDGPFKQILDARVHLFEAGDRRVGIEETQFCRFLLEKGVDCHTVEKALHFPIMQFRTADGSIIEDCLYEYTSGTTYQAAFEKFTSAIAQFVIF